MLVCSLAHLASCGDNGLFIRGRPEGGDILTPAGCDHLQKGFAHLFVISATRRSFSAAAPLRMLSSADLYAAFRSSACPLIRIAAAAFIKTIFSAAPPATFPFSTSLIITAL